MDGLIIIILHIVEPQLSGIKLKRCGSPEDGDFVLVYVPKGSVIPYRAAAPAKYDRKKDLVREYYKRIGTHSERIPAPIVRSLYLSNDRATDISVNTVLLEVNRRRSIKLGVEVNPDPTRLTTEYYLEAEAILLDKEFRPLLNEPINIGQWLGSKYPIPPEDKPSIFHEYEILIETLEESGVNSMRPYIPDARMNGTEIDTLTANNIYAIYVKTEFACDGVAKRVKNRIILTGHKDKMSIESWNASSFWVNEKCEVVRYISIAEDNVEDKHNLENFIENNNLC